MPDISIGETDVVKMDHRKEVADRTWRQPDATGVYILCSYCLNCSRCV